jgi:hypothetical protein
MWARKLRGHVRSQHQKARRGAGLASGALDLPISENPARHVPSVGVAFKPFHTGLSKRRLGACIGLNTRMDAGDDFEARRLFRPL